MSTLMKASHEWSKRPDDERYTSLIDMRDHFVAQRNRSRSAVVSSRTLTAVPDADHRGLAIVGSAGVPYAPTHWAFGQLAQLAEAPANYLRTLPAEISADCLNYGLNVKREVQDVGLLLYKNGDAMLRAATGPNYGRIWNADVCSALVDKFGDGISGEWRVPGEFGKAVTVDRRNTTLYASDRDMFVFLCDEHNKIEIPNRRDGKPGSMSRGFFVWNSEVGSATFGLATFVFDYVCGNRIVWGADEYKEIRIRHTSGAPDRYIEELRPALIAYANSSSSNIVEAVKAAQASRIDDKLDEFLANRFGKRLVPAIKATFAAEENRPIETLWDVTTAATAYARGIPNQNDRVEFERTAGNVMALAA